jgi:chloramphenicol 3-O phosphotransferase
MMIILLNGTSSAGKTTVARIMQEKYRGVLLLYGVDTMVQTAFPAKCDYPPFDEQAIKLETSEVDGHTHARLIVSPYMYPVYTAAVRFYRMLSEQGYHLIVDELLFDANRITPYFEILSHEKVYFIGLQPEKEVVLRREQERGDRIPGLAAGLYQEVYHPLFTYDLLLDTGKLDPQETAERILEYVDHHKAPRGFSVSAKKWLENR